MATSLAQQLQGIRQTASNVNFQKRKKVASLIFDPAEAADQDLDQVYAVAINGFEELLTHRPDLSKFSRTLFAEDSKALDRYMQTKEQNDALDKKLIDFMHMAATQFLLRPMHKCLEWLIRRFDIHVHLGKEMLLSFLPFHASPTYSRMLAIITLPADWSFLSAVKKANEPPSIILFISAFHKNSAILTEYLEHVQTTTYAGKSFHALISQYADICVRTISLMRDSHLSEDAILSKFLPYVGEALRARSHPEFQVANYMILTVLSATRRIAEDVNIVLMRAVAQGLSKESQRSGLVCLAQLCQAQDGFVPLHPQVFSVLNAIPDGAAQLMSLAERYRADKLVTAFCLSLVEAATPDALVTIKQILSGGRVSTSTILHAVVDKVLASADYPEFRVASASFFEDLQKEDRFSKVMHNFYENIGTKVDDLELALQITLDVPAAPKSVPKMRRRSSSKMTIHLEDEVAELTKLPQGHNYLSFADVRRTINVLQAANALDRFDEVTESPVINETLELHMSFLARAALSSNDADTQVQALKRLCAFCKADTSTDYQALIPITLCLLSSKAREVRQSALDLVDVLEQHYNNKPSSIWGLETLYGSTVTEQVKWLSTHDAQRFLQDVIQANRGECLLDHKVIYRQAGKSMTTHGTKGKELNHRGAVLHCLSSHMIASPIMKISLKILLCLDKIDQPSAAKTKAVFPLLENWTKDHQAHLAQSRLELIDPNVVQKLLFAQVVPVEHGPATALLLSLVEHQHNDFGPVAIDRLTQMFTGLKKDTKAAFVRALIEAIIDGPSTVSRQALLSVNSIHVETELYAQMINELDLSPPSSRLSTPMKKQKKSAPQVLMPELTIRRLTHLLEILDRDEEQHNALLPLLFGKLGDLVLLETETTISVSYTQQVLLSCMYPMVDAGRFDPSTSRIDILTNCIRSSSSPQVHNRALLLVAALAEATPEQVLHGVMPIFTFMGANILRQDDGFSAHVIESTIQRVVPPLLRSLGDEAQDQIAGAAGILRSFVDAFPHIPKHRRTKLFSVLIQTLGENVFLGPLLAILAEKRANTSSKSKSGESQQSYLEFTLSLLRLFSVASQLNATSGLVEIARSLSETTTTTNVIGRSIFNLEDADAQQLARLQSSIIAIVGGHFSSKKVRAEFTIYTGDDEWPEKTIFIGIVESLLRACEEFGDSEGLKEKTVDALDRAITLLPSTLFKVVVTNLLETREDEFMRFKALGTITKRASTTDPGDEVARTILHDLVQPISSLLSITTSASLLCSAWHSISTIGRKSGKAGPATFTKVVEIVIGDAGLQNSDLAVRASAIECLTTLVVVLGPRILPNLQKFMPIVFDGFSRQVGDKDADLVPLATVSLLESLVRTIPTFMTPHTQAMVEKCVDFAFATDELTADKRALLSTIATHMPTRNVLQALGGAWDKCNKSGKKSLMALVSVIEETIDNSERKVVTGAAKEILALFLQALDLRRTSKSWNAKGIEQVEKRIIAALLKLVLKLNDSTFRPLFVRLRDWALNDLLDKDSVGLLCRRTTFFNFFNQFTKTFKSIVLNYFNYVNEDILELLAVQGDVSIIPRRLWTGIVGSLENGFASDNEDFWRSSDKFDRFAPSLIKHLEYAETYPVLSSLVPTIVELTAATSSEDHFKLVNAQVLQLFRAESAAVRLAAVTAENKICAKIGDEWLPLLPQTIPFIAEALEDEDERVEKETHALAMTIESFLGESLDTYLR